MGSIPLPALDVHPPQQPDPLGQYQKLVALRSLQNQQQLQQQEIQQNQQKITDTQAVRQYMAQNPQSTLGDAANALKGKISLPAYTNLIDTDATIQQKHAMATDAQLKNLAGVHDAQQKIYNNVSNLSDEQLAKQWPQIAQEFNSIPGNNFQVDPTQPLNKDQLQQHGVALGLQEAYLKQEQEKRETQAKTQESQAKAASENAAAAATQQESAFYAQNPSAGAPRVPAETVQMLSALKNNPGLTPATYPIWKAQQTEKAELPYKVATAKAEGEARQLIQGMGESVYAFTPNGRTLMSKTDAIKQGLTMVPVNEKAVGDDIQLNNRLGDVYQKLQRYEDSLKGLGTTISTKDQGNIAAIIAKGGFKVGAFGTELPMDRLNAALKKENVSNLSEDAKKALVAYYNARESMQGYQRVLSGSGRGNEKAMELNLDALPDIATADRSIAAEGFNQFKENLANVGQGLPKIPGIKGPREMAGLPSEQQTKVADPLGIR